MSFLLAISIALQLFHQGMDLYYQGRYREAVAAFTEAIRKDPSLIKAYRERAKAEEKLGFLNKALEDVNYFLQKFPEDQDALYLRVRIFLKKRNFNKALEDVNKLLYLHPEEPTYLYAKGLILESMGNFIESSKCFKKASSLFLDENMKNLSAYKARVDEIAHTLKTSSSDQVLSALQDLEGLIQGKYPIHLSPAMPYVARIFFRGEGMAWFLAKNILIEYARRVPQQRAWLWNQVLREFNGWKEGKKKKEIKKMQRELSSLYALMGRPK